MLTWQGRVIRTRRNFPVKMPARGPSLGRMKQGLFLRKRDMDTMELHQANKKTHQNPTLLFHNSGSVSFCEDVKPLGVALIYQNAWVGLHFFCNIIKLF